MLWDLNEGKHLYTLDGGDAIRAMCFSPNRYWLCAATGPSIKIWVRILIFCLVLFLFCLFLGMFNQQHFTAVFLLTLNGTLSLKCNIRMVT